MRTSATRSILLALAALLLGGCSGDGPLIPENAVLFDPPAIYEQWWQDVEARAGQSRPERQVQWFVVEGGLFDDREGGPTSGRWIPDGRIYLAGGWTRAEGTVKHEMLHEILQGDYNHEHPGFSYYANCYPPEGPRTYCELD